jgi:thiamine pyrophosphate-dependent acetolactate synthase large subunit-like protein
VVGSQVGIEGADAEMLALAEKLSVPVAETMHSLYANFPNDHPLFVGELQAQRYPRKQDLLISFGESFTAGREDERGLTASGPRRLVHISHESQALGRSFAPDVTILSDLRAAIRDLSDAVDAIATEGSNRQDSIDPPHAGLRADQQPEAIARDRVARNFDSSPVTWSASASSWRKVLDKDAVIVPELGTQYYKIYRQLKLGGSNKQRIGRTKGDALGWGVAAAFGVNLALPDRQVVALQGDGGFLFNQSEALWSIARYEAPMLIVIMNNHSYNESRAAEHAQRRHVLRGGQGLQRVPRRPERRVHEDRRGVRAER